MKSKLSESVLFAGLDEAALALIEKSAQTRKTSKGEFIFFQNDPADRFYLVLSGKVRVFKTSPDGKEQILLMPGPGQSFGEAALFAEGVYPANAVAAEDSELMTISREAFMNLVKTHPTLAVNMIGRLSMLLHHLTHLVEQLSLEDVGTRLAGYILSLLPDDHRAGAVTITLTEKKMVLASLLGTIPETLSRAFARLTASGAIAVDGQEVTILDRKLLADIASGKNRRA
jgi:CRP-like cAMP-binding protein